MCICHAQALSAAPKPTQVVRSSFRRAAMMPEELRAERQRHEEDEAAQRRRHKSQSPSLRNLYGSKVGSKRVLSRVESSSLRFRV